MDELLSEKEQIEVMRSWWRENGAYVVAGILIGVGGIFGYNEWKSSQIEIQMEASTLFEALAEEIAENRVESAEDLAGDLYADYAETIYADQSRLAMARLYMDQGRDQDAADALQALLESDGDADIQLVARLRLAKILLYQGKPDDVLTLLEGYAETGMAARFNEAIGDAHVELGDYGQAEEAYLAALGDRLASQLIDVSLLQMKISDLPDVLPEDTSTTNGVATEEGGDVDAGVAAEEDGDADAGAATEEGGNMDAGAAATDAEDGEAASTDEEPLE